MRRVCIAIGVSLAEGLAPLRAAATAAEEIGQWAELSGFAKREDIQVLTDRQAPVTIELIAATLERLLPMGQQADALLLHFAGHGLREDNTRTLWLPTNWRTTLRAIAVERLKNRLSDFGIANVTIISDACKGFAQDRDTSDLTPDGVLGAGTGLGSRPIFDRFDAVHDIESAFMIPGPTPADSRCLFSGAVIEALWGATEAIDPRHPGKVTPGSLADYLSSRVAELCAKYQLGCQPQNVPGRPEDHLIYFDQSQVDASVIPILPAWPAPVGAAFERPDWAGPRAEEKGAFDDPSSNVGATSQVELSWWGARAQGEAERSIVDVRKEKRRRATASAFLEPGRPRSKRANLLFGGGEARAIWSCTPVRRVAADEWFVTTRTGISQQLVVEYEDGIFVPVVVYSGLVTVAARDARGTNGWLLRESSNNHSSDTTVGILSRMQSGDLPPSEVDEVAAVLRQSKHGNPVIGAICSYLYDYAGDLDSIRRMAFFYANRGQPVPYDVALMGELLAQDRGPNAVVEVPAVRTRRANSRGRLPDFVTNATPRTVGAVAGSCPWLRQGWDFVEAPTDREEALVHGLPDIRTHLLPETFTSLTREGGEVLTKFWGMEQWR